MYFNINFKYVIRWISICKVISSTGFQHESSTLLSEVNTLKHCPKWKWFIFNIFKLWMEFLWQAQLYLIHISLSELILISYKKKWSTCTNKDVLVWSFCLYSLKNIFAKSLIRVWLIVHFKGGTKNWSSQGSARQDRSFSHYIHVNLPFSFHLLFSNPPPPQPCHIPYSRENYNLVLLEMFSTDHKMSTDNKTRMACNF